MELLDQLEAETPENPALAPKVRVGVHMVEATGTGQLPCSLLRWMTRSFHALATLHTSTSTHAQCFASCAALLRRAYEQTQTHKPALAAA